MRQIIVDGYNVIRADPAFQQLEQISLEHARDVLVRTLASSPRLSNDEVVVVFDGRFGHRQHVHSNRLGRILILYSAQGQTADDVIVQQARMRAGRGTVIVVTNDVSVRESCRAAGCAVSGSENLLNQVPGGGRRGLRPDREGDEEGEPTLSTVKKGNPKRSSRRARQQRDIRF